MKIHDVEQQTLAWCNLHIGIPTAGGLDNLLTPEFELRKGETPKTYIYRKPIGKALAEDLMRRVRATESNEESFLKFAGVNFKFDEGLFPTVEDYEQISDERYDSLDEILRRKEGKLI